MSARLLSSALILVATATAASADTIVVDVGGGGDHTVIQDGIQAASEGDTVLVMPGTYEGDGNTFLDFDGVDIVLMSTGGARSTVIDCGGATLGFYFHSFETPACVVDGFTITDGASNAGAGMYFISSNPTIRNCVFAANNAESYGGGVHCAGTSPTFADCTFTGNTAGQGGAVSCELIALPTFTDCAFTDNTADWNGGGVYATGNVSPTLTDCTFTGNQVLNAFNDGGGLFLEGGAGAVTGCDFVGNSAPAYGGGAMVRTSSTATFTDCTFVGNSSNYGSGMTVYEYATPTLNNCVFDGNTAVYEGGALYCEDSADPDCSGSTFHDNSAGESGGAMRIYSGSSASLFECTLARNSAPEGSGIWTDETIELENCIIAFGTQGEAFFCDGDAPLISCTDIYGNAGGDWTDCLSGMESVSGNMDADPLFCDAPSDDFTLDASSPCAPITRPSCGLVGAWPVGCDSPVEATSWGAIKAIYR